MELEEEGVLGVLSRRGLLIAFNDGTMVICYIWTDSCIVDDLFC